ncbi:MAG TPA: NfeD family protein [Pyrinomonadaceae bacterium]|nr:NfeD family protein [Pyrinomonadaceae bacterium]
MNASTILILSICIGGLLAALFIAALSRHKKAGTGELNLIGARATVEKTLRPEGYIAVRGELWPARARAGETLESGSPVIVVGARGHLLEVEADSTQRSHDVR